jgi:hypothetical protein
MSAVQKWSVFLRSIMVAIGVLVLGIGALRLGIVEDQHLALWPASDILKLEGLQARQPLSSLAPVAVVQVAMWTLFVYLAFTVLGSLRRGASRRP